jgi:signal transduction histidine kinase
MSLKAKITILSVLVTGTVIAALFVVQADSLVESWLATTYDTAELAGTHVKHLLILRLQQHSLSQEQADDVRQTWSNLLKSDRQFDSLLESTMAQAQSVVEVSVCGRDGKIISSSSPFRKGDVARPLPDLAELRNLAPFRRMLRVVNSPTNYQVTIPIGLGADPAPVYTIRVVVSSILLREDLRPALRRVAEWGAAGILSSVFLAWASARLLTGNLTHISSALDRITRGEEPERWDRHDQLTGEFEAIESKLTVLGHQFRGAAQLRSALDRVLDGVREGILLFGDDGRVTLAGGAIEDVLGVRAADLNGQLLAEILPSNTPEAEELVRSYHAHRVVREQWLDWPCKGASRRVIVNLDFTDHEKGPEGKSALLRIRDAASHRDLESQVGIIARMGAMSRVTSSVAHEIKNPLNSIAVRLDNLQARAESEFPAAEDEIALIVREIERLDRVVRTFLDFSRPIEIANEWFSLTHLLTEVVSVVEPGAVRCGIELRFEHPADEVWLRGDEDLLKEGILNVATNAVEAMPNGGTLRLQLEQEGKQAHILIGDTGGGIPETRKEKIFELYYTTKKDGSGLGLPMAFRAMQLHGGSIYFDSKPRRGTTFHMCLPTDFKADTTAV